MIVNRGKVLKDVFGLEDTFWSPWPWSRCLQVLENAQSSAEESTIFWFVKNEPRSWPFFSLTEISRKICDFFFAPRPFVVFLFCLFFFFRRTPEFHKKFATFLCEDLFFIFIFGEHLRCVLCPSPWPRALCPRLHFWLLIQLFIKFNLEQELKLFINGFLQVRVDFVNFIN